MIAAPLLTDMRVYGVPQERDDPLCIGTVAIPVRDHMNAASVTSLTHTDWSFAPLGKHVYRNISQGNILTAQRNGAVQRMQGEWLMFIDDDMVWAPDQVGRLIAMRDELDLDVLGGLCYRRAEPHQPTLFMREQPTSGAYNYLEDWADDIVEVDATGMAFVVIHKRVFEMIAGTPMPPYEARMAMNPPNFFRWDKQFGEDLLFCQAAKAAGARIFVDTRNEIGHMAEIEIRRRHFLVEHSFRPPEVTAQRQKINDQMGFPTLSEARIKALLEPYRTNSSS